MEVSGRYGELSATSSQEAFEAFRRNKGECELTEFRKRRILYVTGIGSEVDREIRRLIVQRRILVECLLTDSKCATETASEDRGRRSAGRRPLTLKPKEILMILQVTDEDETLILEFLDLDDIRAEKIIPNLPR